MEGVKCRDIRSNGDEQANWLEDVAEIVNSMDNLHILDLNFVDFRRFDETLMRSVFSKPTLRARKSFGYPTCIALVLLERV